MKRETKNKFKQFLYVLFIKTQNIGINILPNHYYSQIPNISELRKDKSWRSPMSMFGVNGSDINEQLQFVEDICSSEIIEKLRDQDIHSGAINENGEDGGYGVVESDFLYSFIRRKKPSKIIQIGCGVSTSIILKAATDVIYKPQIICIDPFPTLYLQHLAEAGKIVLIKEKAQYVDINYLSDLNENDLLFIDSTHTVKPGSEVNKVILEILPRLLPNVWVHFHDIYFPYDYKRDILDGDLFFWLETTLLHAFLVNNSAFKIMLSQSMLHYYAPAKFKKYILKYDPEANDDGLVKEGKGCHFPSSLYLKTQKVH